MILPPYSSFHSQARFKNPNAASICYPQTDLYVPISITISTDGKISMKKEELLEEVYEEDTSVR